VLRGDQAELTGLLTLTPYSESEFNQATEPAACEIEQTRRDFVRWRLSLGGRGDSFSFTLHRVTPSSHSTVKTSISAPATVKPAGPSMTAWSGSGSPRGRLRVILMGAYHHGPNVECRVLTTGMLRQLSSVFQRPDCRWRRQTRLKYLLRL
jgi:hypothetical protein